jgi:hypothetical protein
MSRNEMQKNTNQDENKSSDDTFSSYLKMSYDQLYATLKSQKKSSDDIDKTIDKVKETKTKIERVVKKFRSKVEQKYGHLSEPELIRKGLSHAGKYGLNDTEKEVFVHQVLQGTNMDSFTYEGELRYSPMSRFLGLDNYAGQILNIQPKDQAKLNELVVLYNSTKHLFNDIKNQTYTYRDCAPEAITGKYNAEKHNVSIFIHPLLALLYLPQVEALEKRTLRTNIARMVIQRAPMVANKVSLHENVLPGELEGEFELAFAVAHDPNSINQFSNESPIGNLTKRFKCQVELWKSVLNLRQGRYYSTGYDENDGITGFVKTLSTYDWTHFDGPDNMNIQDEGNLLKKFLSVFSIRPSFTQISSYVQRVSMGYTNVSGLARTTFVNLPVINIRLPTSVTGNNNSVVHLDNALQQTDLFIENKVLVPKNKSVIYSQDMIFFYADRKSRTVNFANVNMGFRNIALAPSFIGATTLNSTQLLFADRPRIGKEMFKLRGVLVLQTPPTGADIVTGCSASIVVPADLNRGEPNDQYLSYNPSVASIKFQSSQSVNGDNQYVSNNPICWIPEYKSSDDKPGFKDTAYSRGCVFFYVKE